MITLNDFKRLIAPLKRRMFLSLSRGILEAVNSNADPVQKLQITVLANDTRTNTERAQEFGFDSYPVKGTAETINLSFNGNQDQTIVICVQDRELRPTDGEEGESIMYSKHDKASRHRIHLKADGSTDIIAKEGNSIVLKADGSIEITGSASNQSIILNTDGSIVNLSGTSQIKNDGGKVAMGTSANELLDLFDQLIIALNAGTVLDPISGSLPFTAATIAAFTAVKTKLALITGTI